MPLILLSTLLHAYLAWRLLPAWSESPIGFAALALLIVASAVLLPAGWRVHRIRSSRWAERLTWGGYLAMGLFSSLFVLSVLRDMALGLAALAAWGWPEALDLPAIVRISGRAVPLVAVAVTAWGFWNARRTAGVVSVDVPIAGLPPALQGFTIAQISDVHVGPTIKRDYVEAIVQAVNRLQPDMVAVTGDLVDGRVPELAPHVEPLARLASRHGSFFVTGNHEYYAGATEWVRHLRQLGLHVLINEHVVLRHDGGQLLVGGITDWSAHHFDPSHRSDPKAALAGAPHDAVVRVLLAHQPRSADAAERAGFQLQLSGHTHGGQFWPWNLFVPLQQPFTAGLNRLRSMWVYTSRGTGYWGPPKRFGAPSEITRVRLVAA